MSMGEQMCPLCQLLVVLRSAVDAAQSAVDVWSIPVRRGGGGRRDDFQQLQRSAGGGRGDRVASAVDSPCCRCGHADRTDRAAAHECLSLEQHQCRRTYRLVTHVGCGLGRRSRFGPVGAPAPQQQAEADGVVRACWAHGRALQLHSMLSVGVSLWMLDVVTCCANSWIRRCSITRCCYPFEWERWSRVLPYVGGRCASGAQSAMSVGSAEAFLACLVGAPVGGGSRGGWGPQTGPCSWPQSDGEKNTLP